MYMYIIYYYGHLRNILYKQIFVYSCRGYSEYIIIVKISLQYLQLLCVKRSDKEFDDTKRK